MYISQGDVNFRTSKKSLPNSAKKITDGILAKGEVTGHAHRLADLEAAELYDLGEGTMLLIVGENGVSIQHEEHTTVSLPAGRYEVVIDREYSDEGERPVAD